MNTSAINQQKNFNKPIGAPLIITGVKDTDREIFLRTDPLTIFNLCQTSKQFSSICNDQKVFRQLIRKHYPNSKETNNPKQQFMALVNKQKTQYYSTTDILEHNIIYDTNNNEIDAGLIINDDVYLVWPTDAYHELNDERLYFTIDGIKPNNGEKYWLMVYTEFHRWGNVSTVKVFLTKESAVNYFLQYSYDKVIKYIIDKLQKYINYFYDETLEELTPILLNYKNKNELLEEILNDQGFKSFIINNKYPADLHEEALFDYIMANLFFNIDPTIEDISETKVYQFVEVIINNEYNVKDIEEEEEYEEEEEEEYDYEGEDIYF